MSEIKQNIVLNFLPLNEQEFSFTVYRRLVEHQEKNGLIVLEDIICQETKVNLKTLPVIG